jgi:hypothetical protein
MPQSSHKVVAMPTAPFDPTSYKERPASDDASVSSYHSRLKNRNRGSVSRSRDIVQDVYDRMGVSYVRGRPSIETLLQDKIPGGSAQKSKAIASPSMEANSGHQRTASRGSVSSQWPPVATPRSNENEEKVSSHRKVPGPKDSNNRRTSMPLSASRSFSRKHTADQRDEEAKTVDFHAPDDERDEISVVSAKSSKSVRDRISMYASSVGRASMGASIGGSSRVKVRHSYGGTTSSKGSHPPKVNLYGGASTTGNEGVKDGAEVSVDPSHTVDQTSCIGGARNRYSGANSASHRSVGDAFLTAINKPHYQSSSPGSKHISRSIPVVEIPSGEVHFNENGSAASSVSGEDFMLSPRQRGGKFAKANAANTEKQIDERVSVQVAILSRKFDAEIRRVENRIDQECKARIEQLERKNEELVVLLSKAGIPM